MKCKNCGYENIEGAVFCAACGGNLNPTTENNESTNNTFKFSDATKVNISEDKVDISVDKNKIEDFVEGNIKLDENTNVGKDIIGMFVPKDKVDEVYNAAQNTYEKQKLENQNNNVNEVPKKKQNLNFKTVLIICLIIFVVIYIAVSYINKTKETKRSNSEITTTVNSESISTNSNALTTTTTITNEEYDKTGDFLLGVEDVFTISGKGTAASGKIERGIVKINDEIQIIGLNHETITTTVVGILENNRINKNEAEAGETVTLILKDISSSDVERGQVLAKPGSITQHTKFKCSVYVLKTEEGGRHTPFFTNYRPQFYFRTSDVTGVIELPEGVEMVNPGDNVEVDVELTTSVALEKGTRFDIREGGKIIGNGIVTDIIS